MEVTDPVWLTALQLTGKLWKLNRENKLFQDSDTFLVGYSIDDEYSMVYCEQGNIIKNARS